MGSFGPGHAPTISLENLVRVTRPGGFGVFNLVEATYKEQGFPADMEGLSNAKKREVVYKSEPFLPYPLGEPDLWSRLYVVRVS